MDRRIKRRINRRPVGLIKDSVIKKVIILHKFRVKMIVQLNIENILHVNIIYLEYFAGLFGLHLYHYPGCQQTRAELGRDDIQVVSRHHQPQVVLVVNRGLQPLQQHLTCVQGNICEK